MANVMSFEKVITIDVDRVADVMAYLLEEILCEREGISYEEYECIDENKVLVAIAKKWLADLS